MKINFTKKQFKKLLKVIHLGDWMINSNNLPDKMDKECEYLMSYILSFTKQFGLEDYASTLNLDEDGEKIYPSRKLEKEIEDYIEDYNNENFWDELIRRMAKKDFRKKFTEKEFEEMDAEEIFNEITRIEQEYGNEFYESGIDNLEIVSEKQKRNKS